MRRDETRRKLGFALVRLMADLGFLVFGFLFFALIWF
jgi:hypothetical protein